MEIIVFEGIWRYHIYLATYDDLLLCHTARTLNLDTIMMFLLNLGSQLLLGCPCSKLGRQNQNYNNNNAPNTLIERIKNSCRIRT